MTTSKNDPSTRPDRNKSSSSSRGAELEKRVFAFLASEIRANRFFAKPECCAVFHKRRYFSRDRAGDIEFDVAVEVSLPHAKSPSMLCLIECKHYEHAVPVSDVEEFFTKVQQVAAAKAKAVVVASGSFQRGAVEFARSKGIGLIRVFPSSEFKWILHRSPSTLPMARSLAKTGDVWDGLTRQDYLSDKFDYYCNARDLFTYSVHDFFQSVISDEFEPSVVRRIVAEREDGSEVPFVSREAIEQCCQMVHVATGYSGGPVSLDAVCRWRARQGYLSVRTGATPTAEEVKRGALGKIAFDPPSIVVFFDPVDSRRERFTLAHELGHLLLDHDTHMRSEIVDGRDVDAPTYSELDADDIRRLEWQANTFASCLLLPREAFLHSVAWLASELGLRDRGFGLVYLDHQPVNTQAYYLLTSALMSLYNASRTAVKIRLKTLGLLTESWERPTFAAPISRYEDSHVRDNA